VKSLITTFLVAATLIVPAAASFAQSSNGPITRAQVKAQVVEAEQQGTLHQSKVHYPPAAPWTTHTQSAPDASYGATMYGSSQSSASVPLDTNVTPFKHH